LISPALASASSIRKMISFALCLYIPLSLSLSFSLSLSPFPLPGPSATCFRVIQSQGDMRSWNLDDTGLVILIYDRFHWKCYIPEIHQIDKLRFLGISQYKFKLRFWFNSNLYNQIWVSGFGGFQGCSILSGICHGRVCDIGIAESVIFWWEKKEYFSVIQSQGDMLVIFTLHCKLVTVKHECVKLTE